MLYKNKKVIDVKKLKQPLEKIKAKTFGGGGSGGGLCVVHLDTVADFSQTHLIFQLVGNHIRVVPQQAIALDQVLELLKSSG